MQLGNFSRTLEKILASIGTGKDKTYVDGYEFEKAILCEYRDYDLMSGLRIIV